MQLPSLTLPWIQSCACWAWWNTWPLHLLREHSSTYYSIMLENWLRWIGKKLPLLVIFRKHLVNPNLPLYRDTYENRRRKKKFHNAWAQWLEDPFTAPWCPLLQVRTVTLLSLHTQSPCCLIYEKTARSLPWNNVVCYVNQLFPFVNVNPQYVFPIAPLHG